MGGGGGDTRQVTEVKPWEKAVPSLTRGLGYLDQWADYASTYDPVYRGNRVADFNPWQDYAANTAKGLVEGNYTQPGQDWINQNLGMDYRGPIQDAMQGAYTSAIQPTIEGQFMNAQSNPYIQSYVQSAIQPLQDQLLNQYLPTLRNSAVASGRYGSGWQAQAETDALDNFMRQAGNVTSDIYNQMYQGERDRQMSAAQMPVDLFKFQRGLELQTLPQLQDWYAGKMKDAGVLAAIGEEVQKKDQAQIDADMQYQYENLYNYLDMINAYLNSAYQLGGAGRTGVTTGGYQPGLAQNLLGGGGLGLGLAGLFSK